MNVVHTVTHRRHHPRTEVNRGEVVDLLESPARAEAISAVLASDGRFSLVPPTEHGLDPVLAVHEPDLVRFLEEIWDEWYAQFPGAQQAVPDTFPNDRLRAGMGPAREPAGVEGRLGYWAFDTASPISGGTYLAARAAVDVALTATDLVLAGANAAYGLCRPPGHHAPRAAFGGYCYLNNAAVAAEEIVRRSGERVTVLDLDYHHGNGTQQIFYERADVQYVSLHGDPERAYPYFAGFEEETGAGPGAGSTLNLPLAIGIGDDSYLTTLEEALTAVDRFAPTALVVSLGVDTADGDPLGDLHLTAEGYDRIGRLVAQLDRPTVVLQEGGYLVPELATSVQSFLGGLLPAPPGPGHPDEGARPPAVLHPE